MESKETLEAMEEIARERRAQQTVFELVYDAIAHEDSPLEVELAELAEMDAVVGRQG